MRVIAAYRQNAMLMNIGNLPDADFSHTNFPQICLSVCQAIFPKLPAYVSSIRCAYSLGWRGAKPLRTPKGKKGRKGNEACKTARSVAIMVGLHPEERDALRLNAGVHGLSMSDYIRQTCLGIRLRRERRKKRGVCASWRELARTLTSLRNGPTPRKRSAEALEVLAALTAIERTITEWAQCKEAANETEERQ